MQAGLSNAEASTLAGVSTSSIARIKSGGEVLLTTISKLINALNQKHFSPLGKPLDFDREVRMV
jgi:predicted transcriptional regulator